MPRGLLLLLVLQLAADEAVDLHREGRALLAAGSASAAAAVLDRCLAQLGPGHRLLRWSAGPRQPELAGPWDADPARVAYLTQGGKGGNLVLRARDDGRILWQVSLKGYRQRLVALAGDQVLLADGDRLLRFRSGDGTALDPIILPQEAGLTAEKTEWTALLPAPGRRRWVLVAAGASDDRMKKTVCVLHADLDQGSLRPLHRSTAQTPRVLAGLKGGVAWIYPLAWQRNRPGQNPARGLLLFVAESGATPELPPTGFAEPSVEDLEQETLQATLQGNVQYQSPDLALAWEDQGMLAWKPGELACQRDGALAWRLPMGGGEMPLAAAGDGLLVLDERRLRCLNRPDRLLQPVAEEVAVDLARALLALRSATAARAALARLDPAAERHPPLALVSVEIDLALGARRAALGRLDRLLLRSDLDPDLRRQAQALALAQGLAWRVDLPLFPSGHPFIIGPSTSWCRGPDSLVVAHGGAWRWHAQARPTDAGVELTGCWREWVGPEGHAGPGYALRGVRLADGSALPEAAFEGFPLLRSGRSYWTPAWATHRGHLLALGNAGEDSTLLGLEPATGAVAWRLPLSLGRVPSGMGQALSDGDRVLLTSGSGEDLLLVDVAAARVLSRFRLPTAWSAQTARLALWNGQVAAVDLSARRPCLSRWDPATAIWSATQAFPLPERERWEVIGGEGAALIVTGCLNRCSTTGRVFCDCPNRSWTNEERVLARLDLQDPAASWIRDQYDLPEPAFDRAEALGGRLLLSTSYHLALMEEKDGRLLGAWGPGGRSRIFSGSGLSAGGPVIALQSPDGLTLLGVADPAQLDPWLKPESPRRRPRPKPAEAPEPVETEEPPPRF